MKIEKNYLNSVVNTQPANIQPDTFTPLQPHLKKMSSQDYSHLNLKNVPIIVDDERTSVEESVRRTISSVNFSINNDPPAPAIDEQKTCCCTIL